MDLVKKYQSYLREKLNDTDVMVGETSAPLSVGIVGGGISGLYSALLLQHYVPNVNITIFEANNRVGGRIHTYKFSEEPYQYCEAGAMRFPCSPCQAPVFQLIDYLNEATPTNPLKLIDFVNSFPSGNRVFVNNTKMKDGRVMNAAYADTHCSELGFSSKVDIGDEDTSEELLMHSLQPVIMALKSDFKEAISRYDKMSLHQYLTNEAGWSEGRINYFEVMCGMTNACRVGLLDKLFCFILQFYDVPTWKTIEGGMSTLPELCAKVIQDDGGRVLLNSKVESLSYTSTSVRLGFRDVSAQISELRYQSYDAVIMATPPSCVLVLKERPHWPADMEHALRSLTYVPFIVILVRFNSRFWERSNLEHPPSLGGTSITDLPSRIIIHPSYGIGDKGKGILRIYLRFNDAKFWQFLPDVEKVQLVLRDLQALYPEVDIASEYAGGTDSNSDHFLKEACIRNWTTEWSIGTPSGYFPTQLGYMYPILAQNRGSVYFAGDHICINPTFVAGALDSTLVAVQQLIRRQVDKDLLVNHLKPNNPK